MHPVSSCLTRGGEIPGSNSANRCPRIPRRPLLRRPADRPRAKSANGDPLALTHLTAARAAHLGRALGDDDLLRVAEALHREGLGRVHLYFLIGAFGRLARNELGLRPLQARNPRILETSAPKLGLLPLRRTSLQKIASPRRRRLSCRLLSRPLARASSCLLVSLPS